MRTKVIAICSCHQRVYNILEFHQHEDGAVKNNPKVHYWVHVEDITLTSELGRSLVQKSKL